MKKFGLISISIAVALMVGCASKKQAVVDSPACSFRGTSSPAPGWVCGERVEGLQIQGLGVFEKSGAGEQFMRTQAMAAARVELAQQFRIKVNGMVDQFIQTTGKGSSETVDAVHKSVSRSVTSETLEGSKLYKSVWSPTGALYVLVGMEPQVMGKQAEAALRTSMKNDQALWQQFQAKKGQDELAAEIAKMDAKQ